MSGGLPITPERMLKELQEAKYVTGMCLAPTSKKFKGFLSDSDFVQKAHVIVREKIAAMQDGKYDFSPKTNAQSTTLRGWERALQTIETYGKIKADTSLSL